MKIIFVLSVKFPTHKAYGVTTSETIRALKSKGHEVVVISRRDIIRDVQQRGLLGRLLTKSMISLTSSKTFPGVFFPLWQILVCLMIRKQITDKVDVVWTREPIVTLIASYVSPAKVIGEIHHVPKRIGRFILKILGSRENVLLAPIKTSIMNDLKLDPSAVSIASMAVTEEFLRVGKHRKSSRQIERRIVVLGNISNLHQRDSYKNLIGQLECLNGSESLIQITFIGIDEIEGRRLLSDSNVALKANFTGYINHDELPRMLNTFDIGIIPYLENDYFRNTFPIKAVEYAATKILILATRTFANESLLQDMAIFYELNDRESLREILRKVWVGAINTEKKLNSAYLWASNMTYVHRVEAILTRIYSN